MLISDFKSKARLYYNDDSPKSVIKTMLKDGSTAIVLYRIMRFFASARLTPLAYLTQWLNKFLNQCLIGMNADFGPGFVLIHPNGVIINSSVKGGSNILLESCVVIGDNHGQSPILGSDIFIGSGAKIFGGLKIGDCCSIGANAVVTKNVPDNHLAVGVPATYRLKRPIENPHE